MEAGLTVAEVTYSNSISVSEHVVMMILSLVRNYLPSHDWVVRGGWNIADCVERSYDLEGMAVGSVAAGRIGLAVLRRLRPFDVELHYTDRHRLDDDVEQELGLTYHPDAESLVKVCDVVTINAPLHPETEHLFDDRLIGLMRRGSYLVNTARGKICDRDAVVRALESGQLAGYAGDVWFPQPAPAEHPWRTMPHEGMTPHISGSSLSAQSRYAAGTRRDTRVLLRGPADPGRVPDRRRWPPGRQRRPLVLRRRRDRGLRGALGLLNQGCSPSTSSRRSKDSTIPVSIPAATCWSRAATEAWRVVMASIVPPSTAESSKVSTASSSGAPSYTQVWTRRRGGSSSRIRPWKPNSWPSGARCTIRHVPPT